MKTSPKISVVVPIFNTAKYLPRCIESIINQSYKNVEIILVDDGSKDDSYAICREYAARDNRIVLLRKENGGVSSARNLGLERASGEFVSFLDSDDYIDKDYYRVAADRMQDGEIDLVIVGFAIENEKGEFIPYCDKVIDEKMSRAQAISCLLQNKRFTCSLADKVFRKSCINLLRFDETIRHNEDLLFLYEAFKKCNCFFFCSQTCFYYYCNNEGSAVHSKFSDKKMDVLNVWDKILAENSRISYVKNQFVRVNISSAIQIVQDGYNNKEDLRRIQANIRRYIFPFMFSSMAWGYKICATLISLNWKLFAFYIKHK